MQLYAVVSGMLSPPVCRLSGQLRPAGTSSVEPNCSTSRAPVIMQFPVLLLERAAAAREIDPMLLTIALVLLAAWLLGLFGLYAAGKYVHVLLLFGIMLLFLGVVSARDAASRRDVGGDPDKR